MSVPKYVLKNMHIKTEREFKTIKRFELKCVLNAINTLRSGSAWVPGYESLDSIHRKLNDMKDKCSVKNWGR